MQITESCPHHFHTLKAANCTLHGCFLAGEVPIVDVNSLTHYGEPYDGNTRFFRTTLFVAAVRASYGEACLIHGADFMPPKVLSFLQ